jgi:DNA-binding transcriptional regulator GbsR (MarR family)
MKKLEILFTETQHLSIDDLMDVTGANKSQLSRAAMQLGLMQIKELAARDTQAAQELVAMNDFKSKN